VTNVKIKGVQFRDNVDETHTTVWSERTVQESYKKDSQVQTAKRTAKVNKKGTVGELKSSCSMLIMIRGVIIVIVLAWTVTVAQQPPRTLLHSQ